MVGSPAMLQYSKMQFAKMPKVPSNVFHDPNANKYQESRMLFFGSTKKEGLKMKEARPKTIQEIKKLQNFVKTEKTQPGHSLNASIKSMAKKDDSFNEFLKSFKSKNEQNWSSIVDMTQDAQEE